MTARSSLIARGQSEEDRDQVLTELEKALKDRGIEVQIIAMKVCSGFQKPILFERSQAPN